jgi:dTDP-4-amino-4,6-dideoxygalactose transaminase
MNNKMKKIKLFDPSIGTEEESAIKKTLQSKFWASGAGTGNVAKFEQKFNKYVGSKQCVAVNNGTSALHLALSLFDIKNKEVILPSMSFVSTAHSIIYNGGIPKFVDIELETMCLDDSLLKESINKNTGAILPVHFGGMPCNLDSIKSISRKNKIPIIEDAAHAVGSNYNKNKIGSHGDAVCFSFHPVKNLSMPTGGAITLNTKNSKKMVNTLNARRWCGISNRHGPNYDVSELGWNFYMNEFSASIGLEQLKKLNKLNRRRQEIARRYSTEISLDLKMPFSTNCSYHLYWILTKNRSKFMKKMKNLGIETGIHYKPITEMSLYKKTHLLENTKKAGKMITSIPIHANLSEDDVSLIIKSVNNSI